MNAVDFLNIPKVEITKEHNMQKQSLKSKTKEELLLIDKWISFCNFGIGFLDVGTNMLKNMKVLSDRGKIFEIKNEFKLLEEFYNDIAEFKTYRNELEDFFYTFIHATPEQKKRVINFQKSIFK